MALALFTRDAEGAAPYASALAPLGLDAIAVAVTRTEPPPDPDAVGRALRAGADVVVVASARAARAVIAARVTELPAIWAVGPATAAALEAGGLAARLPDEARDAVAVAHALIAAHPLPIRVLVPRAEDGRDEAIAILRAAGAEVIEVVAYRTVAIPPAELAANLQELERGEVAICVVFAPSQVAALRATVPLAQLATQFVAIGQTTAAALREAGVAEVAVAETPTPEGIANAVAAVYPPRR